MLTFCLKSFWVSLILCFLLSSCHKTEKPYPMKLLEIERLADTDPQEAQLLLLLLSDRLDPYTEEQRMYYDLMSLKVKDKLYIRHTSDSLIKRITAFYETYGDRDKLMESYFYRGRVCLDLQDSPEALKYFQKALDISAGTEKYQLLSKIYSQMGTLYNYQGVYEQVIPVMRKAYNYILLSGDSTSLSLPIREMARMYSMTQKNDSAVMLYNQAYELALQAGNQWRASEIATELSMVYDEMGQYEQALRCIQTSLQDTVCRDLLPSYNTLGHIYLNMSQLDSAEFYLRKCLESDDIYLLSDVYRSLSEVEVAHHNYKEAIRYVKLYWQNQDSIEVITTTAEVRKIHSMYDYQLREKENQRLSMENMKVRTLIYQLVSFGLILLVAFLFVIYMLKRKRDRSENQARKLRKEKEAQYRESLAYMEENNRKIAEMEIQLSQGKEREHSLSDELIKVRQNLLFLTNRQIELRKSERDLLEANFKRSPIYLKFHAVCHDCSIKVSNGDWIELGKQIDQVYGDMTHRLYELNPSLSLSELYLCYLIKISIKVSYMPLFLNRSKSTISSARNRLFTKLTGKKGSPEGLDSLISDF